MINQLLIYFILIPFVGLILSSFFANKQESIIYGITITTIVTHVLGALAFTIFWLLGKDSTIFYEGIDLYKTSNTHFSIDFYFDKITVFYGMIASIITFLVSKFSRTYMHRDKGFKRFFNNVLFFYLGINIIIFAGNFETLFIGWEVIGIASFLLISFYRDRYLPVKNALKVISFYRLADIFLLLGIWVCHHVFERSITFQELHDLQVQHLPIIENDAFKLAIPLIFLVVALIKSAQFPFSSWLPRAMEGPTTSSAIFYGSLSVHIGVFLLLRTSPLWEDNTLFKVIVVCFGLFTTFTANGIARVQSTVKTQIAYSSIAQIGLMFVEVALGWHWLALFHFAGNTFLRTYQLLVSPSVLSYMIHDQFFNFIKPQNQIKTNFWGKIRMTIYVLAIKEWNLDWFMYKCLWNPLKSLGNSLTFISNKGIFFFFVPVYAISLFLVYNDHLIPVNIKGYLPILYTIIGLIMILKAFTERKDARMAWLLIILNQLFTSLSIAFNEQFEFSQIHLYLSGIVVSGIIGYLILRKLVKEKESVSLDGFHGHSYLYPTLGFVFLIVSLGLSGFPITPTFIGEDIILGHIHQNQYLMITLTAMSLILDGLAIFRIYARLFLGPHYKMNHEVAYRSS
ncbi:proton-conducting transporter membrane subunit [Emticicia sp.]|uniref:proton-conducting transporter transmembrane domain-containing protein n=1 Tax=Emticicia sp. TaxID=1930953 RepID=UPI003752EC73